MTSYSFPLLLALLTPLALAAENPLRVATIDPLVKVFRNTPLPGDPDVALHDAARGETATFQVVAWSAAGVENLRASVTPFRAVTGEEVLEASHVRFVGYITIDRPTKRPASQPLHPVPGDFPDPLLVDKTLAAPAGAQPIWITLPIPLDAEPGEYEAMASVSGEIDGQPHTAQLKLKLRVWPPIVAESRLWVTNWWRMTARHLEIDPQPGTPEYWNLMRRYARNMASHRQNVALISPLKLVDISEANDGSLKFDFDTFDRWVRIFQEEGVIGRIEGGHIGTRLAGWESQFGAFLPVQTSEGWTIERVATDDPRVEPFFSQFFPALVQHLKQRGWLDIYMQHIADEPMALNRATYLQLAALAEQYAPELPIIEATHNRELVDIIDIWVPQLHDWSRAQDFYAQRRATGDELWFYTCMWPQGDWANRFVEQPLLKTRLLHWINYKYGATGYLHWGYNAWSGKDPFENPTREHGGDQYLPAGDAWIVYPGKDGPLDSIRWEAVRDGIADYELLAQLGERNPERAQELAHRLVPGFKQYELDPAAFRATRRELLQALTDVPAEQPAAQRTIDSDEVQ